MAEARRAYAARYRGGSVTLAAIRDTPEAVWAYIGGEAAMWRAGWEVVPVVVTVREERNDG